MSLFSNHLQRVKAGATQALAIEETSRWITENTFIGGKPYSYKDHEYQQRILDSKAQEVVIKKCSQVGITELSIRKSLAMCGMIKNFSVGYTLPTSHFAATVSKTRVNPIISESPFLKELASELDNVEVKKIGSSFLYLRGCTSNPVSLPLDYLVHDEVDASNVDIVNAYQSRLTHSRYKMKMKLSTPTIPGKGIDYEFSRSKRHFLFVKCSCCGHQFLPNYYSTVRIPGFIGDLQDVTKRNLHEYDYKNAFVECPNCGGKPSLQPEFREWVCENPSENFLSEGFAVQPFDAPNIITPGYLVEASTQYTNVADFHNNNLGEAYYSQESVLSPQEIEGCIVKSKFEGGACVMGVDLGKTCHICIASTSWDGSMQVVRLEAVPLQLLRQRYKELRAHYRVRSTVIDSLPYTDLVLGIQAEDPNCWASVYVRSKAVQLFSVKQQEENDEKGLQQLRQLNVNRDKVFDSLMAFVRSGQFSKLSCENDAEFVKHCTDMRRVKDWNSNSQEIEFKWVKSEQGDDHYFFALSFAFLAKHLLGTFSGPGVGLPLLSTFRVSPTFYGEKDDRKGGSVR